MRAERSPLGTAVWHAAARCSILTFSGTFMNMFAVLLLGCSPSFAAESIPVLVPGVPVVGSLLPSASLSYRVLAAEDFRVLVQQGHWDFAIDILEVGDGAVRRTVDAFAYELESASMVRGPAVVRIRRVDSDARPADFTVSIVPLSEAGRAAATVWMRAEDTMTAAREMGKRGSAAALQEAVKLSREALKVWERTGEANAVLRSSLLLADSLHVAASYAEALDEYTKALADVDSAHSRAECLANRGLTYWRLGRFSKALQDMRESLAIWKSLPLQSGLGNEFSNMGLVLWEIGEYDDSLNAFHHAAGVMGTLGNRRGLAFVANNSALVEGTLGDYRASARSFESAAALFDAVRDRLAAGRARSNSARVYLKLGNPSRAESAARRGIALLETSGNQPALADGLNLVGEVLAARGRKDAALGQFHRALSVARAAGEVRAEANALTNIGRVLLTTGGRAAGIAFLQDSLKLWRRFGAPAVEASVLFHLSVGQRDQGDLAAARDSIQAAIKLTEGLRARVAAVDLRVGFMADRLQLYDAAVDIFERSGEVEQAWNAVEMSRARGLLDSVAASRAESEPRRRLRQELNAESVRLARGGSRDAEQQRKRVDLISAELARQQDKEAPPDSLSGARVVSLATVQRVLPDDTAILEFTAGKPAYAFAITKKSIFSFPLRHIATLSSEALNLAGAMRGGEAVFAKDGETGYRKAALSIASAAIWPALSLLKPATRLVVVTDSRLDFPTAALPLPGGGTVIDRFTVLDVPSAGMFVELAKRPELHEKWSVAVLADGVFSREDPRVTVPTSDASPAFSRLIFSGREAAIIASLIPVPDRLLLLGFDATKRAFTSGRLQGYPVIHVSTHSALNRKTPALVFSLVNPDGSARDGFLNSDELAGTDLRRTELLVLSACHSSAGPVIPGEGVQNLARSALLAGAARVIATRWPVDDEAASRLFGQFYALLWKGGLSPAAALRQAQLSLRRETRFRSPYYWGAYYLVGKL